MKFMVRHKDHLQDIRNTTGNHSEAERKLTSLVKHVVLSAKANDQMLQNATKEYLGNYLRYWLVLHVYNGSNYVVFLHCTFVVRCIVLEEVLQPLL